jgi:alpha-ketoglutarate-dependent taurine dioxygenase
MDIFSALSIQGYAELPGVQGPEQALRATEMLGPIIPLNGQAIQELIPKDKDIAISNSFSKQHGRSFFPLHTDTAFWVEPARFIVLFSKNQSQTATRVLPLHRTQELLAVARRNNPIFLRQTVNGPIYSHPWIEDSGCRILYDPCYMQPVNRAAEEFKAASLEIATDIQRIVWTGTNALVIDNWRVLHGRDDCSDNDRVLYKFYRGAFK